MPSACAQGPQGPEPAPRGLHEAHLRHGAAFNPTALLAAGAGGHRGGWQGGLGGVCDQSALWARAEAPVWHSSTSRSPNWSQGPFAPSHVCRVLGPSLPHNEHSTTAGSCTSPIQAGKMCRAVQDSHIFLSLHPVETSGNRCAKSTLQQSPRAAWDRLVRVTQTLPHIPACPGCEGPIPTKQPLFTSQAVPQPGWGCAALCPYIRQGSPAQEQRDVRPAGAPGKDKCPASPLEQEGSNEPIEASFLLAEQD